jgi:group I intron endonuclease
MEYLYDSGIYAILNEVTGKVYIGSAKILSRRWDEHKKYLRRNKHKNPHLQSSWNLYSETSFIFLIMEFVDFELLLEREQYWLDKISESYEIYNCNLQVSGFHGRQHNEETKRKISETKKSQQMKFTHSEETKRKMSEIQKTIKKKLLTEEHKKNISLGSKRLPMSDSNKQKLIEATTIEFTIKDPEGTIHSGKNLENFCRLYDIDASAINAVLKGKRRHHKKWTLPDFDIDLNFNQSHKKYDLIDPNGIRHTGHNLSEFCKTNNLNYKGMYRMTLGKRSHYKQWKNYPTTS